MEKPVKMVVCDLDGTLLYNTATITSRTKEAIRKLRKQGIVFGICSGRSAIALQKMLEVWGIEKDVDFVLGFNGAMYWKPGESKTEEQLKLDARDIEGIMDSFEGLPVIFAEYEGKEMLCTKKNPITQRFAGRNKLKFKTVRKEELVRDTCKLMAIGLPWTLDAYLKNTKVLPKGCRMFRSGPFLIEIVHPALSKLEGIKTAAEKHHVEDLDQIVTFGNDNNDLEMLAGTYGVAMENALESVKKVSRAVTASNKKDGVARFIEEQILKCDADGTKKKEDVRETYE